MRTLVKVFKVFKDSKVVKFLLTVFHSRDTCADSIQTTLDVAVAAVDLLDILYRADTLGTHCRDQERHSRADVGRRHLGSPQAHTVIVSDNCGAVRIAQYYLRTHIYQFVDEEQPALEHLLMNQHRTLRLRRHHEEYRQQIGRKSWPRNTGCCPT